MLRRAMAVFTVSLLISSPTLSGPSVGVGQRSGDGSIGAGDAADADTQTDDLDGAEAVEDWKLAVDGDVGVNGDVWIWGNQFLMRGPGDDEYGNVLISLSNATPETGKTWGIFSNGIAGTLGIGKAYEPATLTLTPDDKVGIGTERPTETLDVEGNVKAHGYLAGDIVFQKEGSKLWRMFEDEAGLYLENLKTGKVYRFVLTEVVPEGLSAPAEGH